MRARQPGEHLACTSGPGPKRVGHVSQAGVSVAAFTGMQPAGVRPIA